MPSLVDELDAVDARISVLHPIVRVPTARERISSDPAQIRKRNWQRRRRAQLRAERAIA